MSKDKFRFPKTKSELVFRQEDDGAFIFDPIADNLRCINETGATVFSQLNGKNSVDDILKKLSVDYPDEEQKTLKKDIETFIEELQKRGFLE